jgi:hypothetical protein
VTLAQARARGAVDGVAAESVTGGEVTRDKSPWKVVGMGTDSDGRTYFIEKLAKAESGRLPATRKRYANIVTCPSSEPPPWLLHVLLSLPIIAVMVGLAVVCRRRRERLRAIHGAQGAPDPPDDWWWWTVIMAL